MKDREIEIDLLIQYDKSAESLKEEKLFTEMGEIISKKHKETVYSIGFISYEGKYSEYEECVIEPRNCNSQIFEKTREIYLPGKESLESQLSKLEAKYAFIDLKEKQEKVFKMSALKNHHPKGEFKTTWVRGYDGLIYIKEMKAIE